MNVSHELPAMSKVQCSPDNPQYSRISTIVAEQSNKGVYPMKGKASSDISWVQKKHRPDTTTAPPTCLLGTSDVPDRHFHSATHTPATCFVGALAMLTRRLESASLALNDANNFNFFILQIFSVSCHQSFVSYAT